MKYILFIAYTLTSLVTGCIASDTSNSSYIQISVRNTWTILISKNGQFCLKSMIDANPLSMACTKEGVIDYEHTKKMLTKGVVASEDTDALLTYGFVRQSHEQGHSPTEKYNVDDTLLFDLLHESCIKNQWQGAGMNNRLLELLDKKPLLEDKEKQNKALQPTR